MSDHEFEKQVHQKLEELKLRPSDTVWMEVEKNIRQDKRRRRFLWLWVPMLLVCLTTSGYILYRYTFNTNNTPAAVAQEVPASSTTTSSTTTNTESSNTSTQNTTSINPVSEDHTQTGGNTIPGSLPQTTGRQPEAATTETTTTATTTLFNKQQPAIVTEKSTSNNNETIGIHNKKRVKKPLASDDHNGAVPAAAMPNYGYTHEKHFNRKKNAAQQVNTPTKDDVQPALIAAIAADADQPQEVDLNATMPVMATDANETIATNKAVTMPFNNQPLSLGPDSTSAKTAAMPIQRKRPSLWHWGIVTDAGYSRIAESKLFQLKGLLGTEKYLAEDLSARSRDALNTANNYSFNSSGVQASTTTKSASPIQPDFSFSVGVFVQRALSPRFKLSLGLDYSYMSVNTQVGQQVDAPIIVNVGTSMATLVPKYYKNAYDVSSVAGNNQNTENSQKHRYRFQYIEVPLKANWQINKGRRMPPLVFEGGFSVARLLSVSALHYEGIKGIYYQDNSLFNKTQFNFVTGLSVGLFQRSKNPVWIGPDLRYALNGLVKKEVSTGQYLWSTGISIKVLLGKL